jgi:hypothetical protein
LINERIYSVLSNLTKVTVAELNATLITRHNFFDSVSRAGCSCVVPAEDMSGFNIIMAMQFLYCSSVSSVMQYMSGKAVPEGMTSDSLLNPRHIVSALFSLVGLYVEISI